MNITELKSRNPEYTYKLLDEESQLEFLRKNYPQKFEIIYRNFASGYDAAKMDFFRYLLMYKMGGVYLDIKSTFLRPLNEIIKPTDVFLVSKWDINPDSPYFNWGKHEDLPNGEFINGVIICERGSEILQHVISNVVHNVESYKPFQHGVGASAVHRLTGPVAYTRAIESINNEKPRFREINYFKVGYVVSIFGSTSGHISLVKKHYSKRLNSIMKINPALDFLVKTVFLLKTSLKKIQKLRSKLFPVGA